MRLSEAAAVGRIARRTARRNWKRTALIIGLVAVPVAAAQITAGLAAASRIAPEEYVTQQLGASDLLVQMYAPTTESATWVEEQLADVAPDAEMLRYRNAYAAIPDATSYVELTDLEVTAPLAQGKYGLIAGRLPNASGEIAVSDGVAELGDLAIGDRVQLDVEGVASATSDLPESFTIVGTIRDALYRHRRAAVISSSDMDAVYAASGVDTHEFGARDAAWLVATRDPDGLSSALYERWERARAGFRPGPAVTPKPAALSVIDDDLYASLSVEMIEELVAYAATLPPDDGMTAQLVYDEAFRLLDGFPLVFPEMVANSAASLASYESATDRALQAPAVLGTIVAALLLAEVALVAGAAYATGIRRRLREVGLLDVNGATGQHLRWIVVGEGLIAGVIGAGIGTTAAVLAMILGRTQVQGFVDRHIEGIPLGVPELIAPAIVGIVAATVAAWIPARAAARVPTTSALEGRMPLASPRRWVVPLGGAMTGLGAFLVIVARTAFGPSGAYQAGLGVALMIGGFALVAGPMVAWMGHRADRLPAITRLVVRDAARQRTRAATAIAATMVVLIAPVVAGIAIATSQATDAIHGLPEDPRHVLVAGGSGYSMPPTTDVQPEDIAAVAELLPNARHVEFTAYDDWTDARFAGTEDEVRGPGIGPGEMSVAIGTRELLDLLGVSAATDALENGKAVVLGTQDRDVSIIVGDDEIDGVEVPASVMRYGGFPRVLLNEDLAATLDLGRSSTVVLFVNDEPLTEREALTVGEITAARPVWPEGFTRTQIGALVFGGTLLAVIIILALVTALAATESDHDLRTMVAVGAAPKIRRRFLGTQTVYFTFVAGVLATPLGLLLVEVSTSNDWVDVGPFGSMNAGTLVIPWAMLVLVIVGMPLVVGGLTALAVRSAPTVPPRRIG